MKKTVFIIGLLLIWGIYGLSAAHLAYANNVKISNVQILDPQPTANPKTMKIQFTLSQENPFSAPGAPDLTYGGATYNDYIWVFIKYYTDASALETTGWKPVTLVAGAGGLGAYDANTGEGIPLDGKGVFIKAAKAAAPGDTFSVLWDYSKDLTSAELSSSATRVKVEVCAIEMVKIPEGPYYYGIGNPSNAGTASTNYNPANQTIPYQGVQTGYEITSASQTPGSPAYSTGWPNGYSSFYLMKYEISQGQYADFLNMLSASDAANRYAGQTTAEYAITKDDANAYGQRYAAIAPQRGCNYLSWDDNLAYASWSGLRPMTEMEFEKAARGSSVGPNKTAPFPWGSTYVDNVDNPLYIPAGHTYPYNAFQYYMNYIDENNNAENEDGPTNVGLYTSGDLTRTAAETGVSPYGVADLSGNLYEQVINCQSTAIPKNGDGKLHIDYSADLNWPGATVGSGLRGGGYDGGTWNVLISNRNTAYTSTLGRGSPRGFRAARTP